MLGRGEEESWLVNIQLMCSVMDGAFSNDKADFIIITAVVRTLKLQYLRMEILK
jgi:hypothetical protein